MTEIFFLILFGLLCILSSAKAFQTYAHHFKRRSESMMIIDLALALYFSPWSLPVVLAALLFYFGLTSLFIGSTMLVIIGFDEFFVAKPIL